MDNTLYKSSTVTFYLTAGRYSGDERRRPKVSSMPSRQTASCISTPHHHGHLISPITAQTYETPRVPPWSMSLVGAKDVPPVGDAKSRSDKALCPPHRALTARLTKQHSGQCDLGFPQCQRCIDLRLACPGPRVGAFFVHAQANASQPAAAQVQQALTRIPPTSALKACRADAFDQLFVSHFIDSFGLPKTVSTGPTWLASSLATRKNAGGASAGISPAGTPSGPG